MKLGGKKTLDKIGENLIRAIIMRTHAASIHC